MPGPAPNLNLVIDRTPRPDYERLRAALQEATSGRPPSVLQAEALAELRACRAQVASPIDPASQRPPSSQDRTRISGLGEVLITIATDGSDADAVPIRLGADLVSVAIALSDELQINELDAALLLFDARAQAAHRPDHDVVAAAKELAALRRRENVLYLQEIVRAALMAPNGEFGEKDNDFVSVLLRERDTLVVEHNVFSNTARRLSAGMRAVGTAQGVTGSRMSLQQGEYVLLAEVLFLLSYTVQLSSVDALSLRDLLNEAENRYAQLMAAERGAGRPASLALIPQSATGFEKKNSASFTPHPSETMSSHLVEAESLRNLLLLSWACALDRSRYQDVFDPRTGVSDVNLLLKDDNFVPRTNNTPKLLDNEEDKVKHMPKIVAAAELCGAVFRLAVANPNEEDALTVAVRVCAYGGALSFLSDDLPSWIGKRAGSLSPDADLYADVLEDLALDISEAPNLAVSLIQFTQNDVVAAASEAAYASFDGMTAGSGVPRNGSHQPPHTRTSLDPSGAQQLAPGSSPLPSSGGRPPVPNLRGRPPKPPGPRGSNRSSLGSGNAAGLNTSSFGTPLAIMGAKHASDQKTSEGQAAVGTANRLGTENLIASLATFVARSVSLAPTKLSVDSIGGGIRYWVGIGASNAGLIPRIGDTVLDLWDASMRNPYAAGGVGDAFLEALKGFLMLLASTSRKQGSPAHAAAALRYLCEAGHPVVSLERASRALSYFHDLLSAPSTPYGAVLDEAEVDALCGIIDVIANAAETVHPHGGVAPILGDLGNELAIRVASLAIHDVTPTLRSSLVHALSALDDRRAISLFLENIASEKSAPLRSLIRGTEAETGSYDVTVRVLELVTSCTAWRDDEYPEVAIESIASWFAIEEILTFWSRRKYTFEAQRWQVVRLAAALISKVVYRSPSSERSFRIVARLLTPAPGTGAASYALRALICASGLMRTGEENDIPYATTSPANRDGNTWMSLYHISGRDSLIHAADHGLGVAYREMQEAAATASRMISLVLAVPSGRISVPGVVVAPACELLLGEVKAISAAASLVFAVNGFVPSLYRAGYDPLVCGAVLAMLARATQESPLIAGILARDPPRSTGLASQFRSSLADIISRSREEGLDIQTEGNSKANPSIQPPETQDPPIMHSALRIVESSLGVDGGNAAGMFMLGLQLDASGHYASAEYGVLGALVELVAGSHDSSARIDSKSRSTAATFLERLAANTVQRTSIAVLEHIKEVGANPSVRGAGFADEMLLRILEAVGNGEAFNASSQVEWSALGELLAACMSLSALQVRLFPDYEVERCISSSGATFSIDNPSGNIGQDMRELPPLPPSPLDLLRVLSFVAGCGDMQGAFEALRKWHHLLGARLRVHDRNNGYSSIPLLFELATALLGALSGPDKGNDLNGLVKQDGGEIAAAAALLCIVRMRDCDKPHELGSEESIGDAQCTALLSGVVRALAGVVGSGADASRARTSLYASLLICGTLAEARVPIDTMARAFGGRLGPRLVSGTEALIAAACADAVSGPTAATKAAAMAAASMITVLDPVRAMPSLGAQNRLRRVVSAALADPEARKLVSQACAKPVNNVDENSGEGVRERAAIVVAEAALSLIHSVSSAGNGARIIADASCIESAATMLTALEWPRTLYFTERQRDRAVEVANSRRLLGSGTFQDVNESKAMVRSANELPREPFGDDLEDVSSRSDGEKRVAMIGAVTGAIAAAVTCADAAVVEGTLVALDQGKTVFSAVLHTLRSSRISHLSSVSALAMIISRIPYDMLTASASPTQLRMSLAAVIGVIIPPVSNYHQLGASGSHLSPGINMRRPENPREARRMRISHPEGGSLFERDVIQARATCTQNVFAALRCPSGLLSLFVPKLVDKRGDPTVADATGQRSEAGRGRDGSRPIGMLSEVLRICRSALNEAQRAAEESMQIDARLAGEGGTSISSRRLSELAEYCQEEFGLSPEGVTGNAALQCLRKASSLSRRHADNCISIFESALFILREYVRAAREAVRGVSSYQQRPGRSAAHTDNDVEGWPASGLEIGEAEDLLGDAKNVLLPVCKEIESMAAGAWGNRDPSFSKQLSRQIRTTCTGRS